MDIRIGHSYQIKPFKRGQKPAFVLSGPRWGILVLVALVIIFARELAISREIIQLGQAGFWLLGVLAFATLVRQRQISNEFQDHFEENGINSVQLFTHFTDRGLVLGIKNLWQIQHNWLGLTHYQVRKGKIHLRISGRTVIVYTDKLPSEQLEVLISFLKDKLESNKGAQSKRRQPERLR